MRSAFRYCQRRAPSAIIVRPANYGGMLGDKLNTYKAGLSTYLSS